MATWKKIAIGIVGMAVLVFLYWAFLAPYTVFQLYDRENEVVVLEVPAKAGDTLTLEVEHSAEHIPWFEYYTILEDGTFNLDAFAVAGYGAGIPAAQESTVRDGMVWTENINTNFTELKWLTSSTYQKGLDLNDVEIFDFRTLPNASLIRGSIITKRGYLNP